MCNLGGAAWCLVKSRRSPEKSRRAEQAKQEGRREKDREGGEREAPCCQSCSLYLCTWEAASRCRSPGNGSFRCPPWCSRRNTSTTPHPRTGTLPPEPPHWPRGGGGHRTPLHNSPDGTTHRLRYYLACVNERLFGASN